MANLYRPDDVLQAAAAIRPYLPDLLLVAEAARLDVRLNDLFMLADQGKDVTTSILTETTRYPPVRSWLRQAMITIEDQLRVKGIDERGHESLPGDPQPALASKHVCPQCPDAQGRTFIWHRRHVGQPLPPCPYHKCALDSA